MNSGDKLLKQLHAKAVRTDAARKRNMAPRPDDPVPHQHPLTFNPTPPPTRLLLAAEETSAPATLLATGHWFAVEGMTEEQQRDYLARDILVPLYDWQSESLAFIERRERSGGGGLMLCHEQGLGKTLITLEHLLRDNQRQCRESGRRFGAGGPTLLVCKDALLLENWLREAREKWPAGTFSYYHLKSSGNECIDPVYLERACDFVAVTYATVRAAYKFHASGEEEEGEEEAIAYKCEVLYRGRVKWRRIVPDEAHLFANSRTLLYRAMQALQGEIKWLVTATPLQNEWQSMLSLFAFIGLSVEHIWSADPEPSQWQRRQMNKILGRVMLRYLRSEVTLPAATPTSTSLFTRVTKRIRLIEFESQIERLAYYQYALYATRKWYRLRDRNKKKKRGKNSMNIGHVILVLLQICTNLTIVKDLVLPGAGGGQEDVADANSVQAFASSVLSRRTEFGYRFDSAPLAPIDGYTIEYRPTVSSPALLPLEEAPREHNMIWDPDQTESLSSSSLDERFCASKNLHIIDYLENEMPADDKAIVFSNSIKALEALGRDLARRGRGIESLLVSGRTPKTNAASLEAFARPDGPRVLLLSLKLGSMGLNITAANHILFLHGWWNPAPNSHAEDRANRIGQTKPVHVVHFVMNGTLELYVVNRAHNKSRLSDDIVDAKRQKKRKRADDDAVSDALLSYNFAGYTISQ